MDIPKSLTINDGGMMLKVARNNNITLYIAITTLRCHKEQQGETRHMM